MDILTSFLLFFVGFFLGLFGGGGGILLVPILTQVAKLPYFLATSYSLFLVGVTAFLGSLYHIKKKNILYKQAFEIIIPVTIISVLTRNFLYPILPEVLFSLPKDQLLYFLFILVMILSALLMLKKKITINNVSLSTKVLLFLLLGLLTGLTGLGGGFLLVPILVIFYKQSIKYAIPTSLFIISLNLLVTFLFEKKILLDFSFLLTSLLVVLLGFGFGIFLLKKINPSYLKKYFAYFLIILAIILLLNF
ncbi:MAG: sulfite exporter TauE/SafE family protein [Nanoarchaeota archaeon]|nr:sulfite exporter TauE/SafE family protein [Nanoarchaeota archaeon]